MSTYLSRARFGDIVTEFAMPSRPSSRVVIFCPGMPTSPSKSALLHFLAKKGFWAFTIRYRGTWESGGTFLQYSPEQDVIKVIDGIERGFRDIYTRKMLRLKSPMISVFGSSFGGAAAVLASRDRRVQHAVALSPVIDWRVQGRTIESIDWTEKFTREAFGEAYRGGTGGWRKLKKGNFYNPAAHTESVEGSKVLLFATKDDRTVSYLPAVRFTKATGAALVLRARGGHLGSHFIMRPTVWKRIKNFLNKKQAS